MTGRRRTKSNIARSASTRRQCSTRRWTRMQHTQVDTIVSILSLCSIPSPTRTLRALVHSVLAPGGQLLFREHVRNPHPGRRVVAGRAHAFMEELLRRVCGGAGRRGGDQGGGVGEAGSCRRVGGRRGGRRRAGVGRGGGGRAWRFGGMKWRTRRVCFGTRQGGA